jgi:hypothetical protein
MVSQAGHDIRDGCSVPTIGLTIRNREPGRVRPAKQVPFFYASNDTTGSVRVTLRGEQGNDNLWFGLQDESGGTEVQALLDGGTGKDTCAADLATGTADIQVVNCEP